MSDIQGDDLEDFIEDEDRKCCSWVRDCLDCCERSHILRKIKRIFTFIFTYLGLIFMVTCYCLFGAVLFEYLEKSHEIEVKRDIKSLRHQVMEDIWTNITETDVLMEKEWNRNIHQKLKEFEADLIKAMKVKGWNGHEDESNIQWTFANSLFYSIVCITSIGYGDQAPKTQLGKIGTILYVIIGFPLMIICVNNTGAVMAEGFRFIYWRICCFVCINSSNIPSNNVVTSGRASSRGAVTLRGHMSPTSGGTHSSIQTLSPTKFPIRSPRPFRPNEFAGSLTPNVLSKQMSIHSPVARTMANHRRALSVRSKTSNTGKAKRRMNRAQSVEIDSSRLALNNEDNFIINVNQDNDSDSKEGSPTRTFSRSDETRRSKKSCKSDKSIKSTKASLTLPLDMNKVSSGDSSQSTPTKQFHISRVINHMDTVADTTTALELQAVELEYENYIKKRPVPLKICFFLVLSYVLFGAYIFQRMENWSYLNAAYFCVITLTTIGFGDLVPKNNDPDTAPEVSIALSSLYILVGISLLSMTYNMVQDQVMGSIKRMAFRIGLIKEDDLH